MGMHTVEPNLLKLESKKFINGGKGITNAKIGPKKGTHRKLRKNNLALSHNSESPLNMFYNLQKDHIPY